MCFGVFFHIARPVSAKKEKQLLDEFKNMKEEVMSTYIYTYKQTGDLLKASDAAILVHQNHLRNNPENIRIKYFHVPYELKQLELRIRRWDNHEKATSTCTTSYDKYNECK